MAELYILIGKIASGKTYYAKHSLKNAVLLSCDDLMLEMFDHCLGEKHDEYQEKAYRFFFGLAEQLNSKNIDCVLDFGFWTKKSREFTRNYFDSKNIAVHPVYFNADDEIRKQRLKIRNKQLQGSERREYIINAGLLNKLDLKFETPSPEEYIERIDYHAD